METTDTNTRPAILNPTSLTTVTVVEGRRLAQPSNDSPPEVITRTSLAAHKAFMQAPRNSTEVQENATTYQNAKTTTTVHREEYTYQGAQPATNDTFSSREAMLDAEIARRNSTVPKATRGGYKAKMKHVANADIERPPLHAVIRLQTDEFKENHGIDSRTLQLKSEYFPHSPLNGQTYIDGSGNVRQVQNAISTSEDRSTDALAMARVLTDETSNESIFYGGRPDTAQRAKQQAEDIFRTELKGTQKGLHFPQGRDSGEPIKVTMDYVVDSLTNITKLKKPTGFDERASFLQEKAVLAGLYGQKLLIEQDGKTYEVEVRPIHTHHTLSCWAEMAKGLTDSGSGRDLEDATWESSRYQLATIGTFRCELSSMQRPENATKKKLILDTIEQMKKPGLSTAEKLMLTDFLSRLLDLPVVHHCKSIIDRTSVAASVGGANHYVLKGDLSKIPKDAEGKFAPQLLMQKESYKELFMAVLNMQHQLSQDSRMGMAPDGKLLGGKTLGLQLKSGMTSMKAAMPFFPSEAVRSVNPWKGRAIAILTGAALFLFAPIYYLVLGVVIIPAITIKTKSWKGEIFGQLALLPITIWRGAFTVTLDKEFVNDSRAMNGDGRHINRSSKLEDDGTDPRVGIFPKHLISPKKEGQSERIEAPQHLTTPVQKFETDSVISEDDLVHTLVRTDVRRSQLGSTDSGTFTTPSPKLPGQTDETLPVFGPTKGIVDNDGFQDVPL